MAIRYEPLPGKIALNFQPGAEFALEGNPRVRVLALDGKEAVPDIPVSDTPVQKIPILRLPLKGADYKVQIVRDAPRGGEPIVIEEGQLKTLEPLDLNCRAGAATVSDYETVLVAAGIDPDEERARQTKIWVAIQRLIAVKQTLEAQTRMDAIIGYDEAVVEVVNP